MIALLLALTLFGVDDSLTVARDLYASAAYEDALAVLNRLPEANLPTAESRSVQQYRALCLIALGRDAEAQHAIEAVVGGDPSYQPATDLSPRVRAAFADVRKRMLPALIQQQYTQAKAAFDRKEFEAAATGFTHMLEAMTDPDAVAVSNQPPLSDLRTLAAGFRDLAITALTPPPPPPPPAPAPVAPAPAAPKAPRSFTSTDANVVAPVPIKQELPPFPGPLTIPRLGLIEILIDERGAVESAIIRQSISAKYDAIVLDAARTWRYRPASMNGVPVKFRKAVQITVKGDGRR
jgi:hypothetical protein